MFEVSVERTFAAGHALRNYKGKCENVHGHNFRVAVMLEGDRVDGAGMLVDFVDVQRLLDEIIGYLDHRFINDLAPFDELSPSAENLAQYFYERISGGLRVEPSSPVRVQAVRVWETDTASATYRP